MKTKIRKTKVKTDPKVAKYQVDVPEAKSGNWAVERFEVDEQGASHHNLREAIHGTRRYITPGIYTRLMYHNNVIMSDTPSEINDHMDAINRATGRCLVNGLGLGMVVNIMLQNDKVEHVIVVEKSSDVIKMVADHYRKKYEDRLTIVEADAFEYKPPRDVVYDVVWHDIWPDICSDYIPEIKQLRKKYSKKCKWQGCWAEYEHKHPRF